RRRRPQPPNRRRSSGRRRSAGPRCAAPFPASLAPPFARNPPAELTDEAPEEERDPPPDVHRVLMTLRRGEHFAFELAGICSERFADPALCVRRSLCSRVGPATTPGR